MAQIPGECYKAALLVEIRCIEQPESVVNEVNASKTAVA
jgi:hypothetical protein